MNHQNKPQPNLNYLAPTETDLDEIDTTKLDLIDSQERGVQWKYSPLIQENQEFRDHPQPKTLLHLM